LLSVALVHVLFLDLSRRGVEVRAFIAEKALIGGVSLPARFYPFCHNTKSLKLQG
jgi:hypothetical protein